MIKVIVCKKIWKNIIHKLSEALKRKLMPYSYQLSKLLLQKRRYISPFVFVEAIKKWSGMRVSLLFCGKRLLFHRIIRLDSLSTRCLFLSQFNYIPGRFLLLRLIPQIREQDGQETQRRKVLKTIPTESQSQTQLE